MIVLAILSLAITTAYATANRSLVNTRQATENAEASRIAETQVERLRLMTNNPATLPGGAPNPDYIFTTLPPTMFCIDTANKKVPIANNNPYTYSNYTNPSACIQGIYYVSVTYTNTASDPDKFLVTVVWDDALGQGQDSVKIPYRIHP
jgi:type II secretory pathway pseudopilin PulG